MKLVIAGIGIVILVQLALAFIASLALIFVNISPQGFNFITSFIDALACLAAGFLLGRNAR